MKVLVTGAAGFIGSHVMHGLASAGHALRAFDLRQPAVPSELILGDLTSLDDCLRATEGMDAVCHLGGIGDVYLAGLQPHVAAAANVCGTANLMEACFRNGVGKVVYASTWEVYGEPVYEPVDEAHPCRPRHPYSITKLAGEQIALSYDYLNRVRVVSLRLGTAYGENMRRNSVFSIFIQSALSGQPLTIKGSGAQFRQFTHVRDITRAFLMVLAWPGHGDIFNVVGSETITIETLARKVSAHYRVPIVHEPARAADAPAALVSSEKIARLLNWKPEVRFDDGLAQLLQTQLREVQLL